MLHKVRLFFTIDLDKLRATRQGLPLFIDILMVILVMVNLGLIFFDWSYTFPSFKSLVEFVSPAFNHFYATKIHPNTSFLDLIFVSIFLTELLIRWGLAIYRRSYNKWFFYPFVHWYDVLGCIPMNGTFKFFRLFRIFGMVIRLNNLGIINLKSTYIYRKSSKYIKLFIEEISDKVVSNVIEGVQDEIKKDSPLLQKITTQVLVPKKDQINQWLNDQISETVSLTYYKHRNDLYQYLQAIVQKSVYENPEIKRISLIPGIGKQIALALESSISNITFNVVDNAMEDMAKTKRIPAIEDITDHMLNSLALDHAKNAELNDLMKEIAHDTLEMVKKQVEVKLWRIKELNERKASLLKRLESGRGNADAIRARIEIIDDLIKQEQDGTK